MLNKIYNFLSTNLNNAQFGFQKNSSAVQPLLLFIDELHNNYDSQENDELHVVYLDFQKAFDSVAHQRLADKLSQHGLGGKLLGIIGSYLSHRLQRVKISDASSPYIPVISGVPQGSVLGPLFFIVHVNDLCNVVTLAIPCAYADDFKLNSQSAVHLQHDINQIIKWRIEKEMNLNAKKMC